MYISDIFHQLFATIFELQEKKKKHSRNHEPKTTTLISFFIDFIN